MHDPAGASGEDHPLPLLPLDLAAHFVVVVPVPVSVRVVGGGGRRRDAREPRQRDGADGTPAAGGGPVVVVVVARRYDEVAHPRPAPRPPDDYPAGFRHEHEPLILAIARTRRGRRQDGNEGRRRVVGGGRLGGRKVQVGQHRAVDPADSRRRRRRFGGRRHHRYVPTPAIRFVRSFVRSFVSGACVGWSLAGLLTILAAMGSCPARRRST